eukprot:4097396-Prymnesium_polylepis.2
MSCALGTKLTRVPDPGPRLAPCSSSRQCTRGSVRPEERCQPAMCISHREACHRIAPWKQLKVV